MEATLDKSLDDLIKEQRQKKDKPHTKKQIKGKAAPKMISPKAGGSGQKRNKKGRNSMGKRSSLPAPHNITVTVQGAVAKPTGRAAPRPRDPEIKNPELRAQRLEGPAKWKHDMFTDNRPRGPRAPSHLGTKLYVSNLDYKVSDADIKELFETVGPLASHAVHYDRSGRSNGTAEAVFKNREDAEKAQRKYNGVQLDGKAMGIELIEKGDGGQILKSGIRISAPGPSSKAVTSNRALSQAVASATQAPRGRGSVRSSAVAMDM